MKKMMKRANEKVVVLLLVVLLICSFVTGCGNSASDVKEYTSASDSYKDDYGFDSSNMESGAQEEEMAQESYATELKVGSGDSAAEVNNDEAADATMEDQTNGTRKNSSQKIIKRYNYDYETEHFDNAYMYLKNQIETYGGYISSSEMQGGASSSNYRTLYMTARIPAEESDKFVSELGQLGTIVRQSETAEDVTLQYSDTESRIEALEIEQDRLNALLEQADSLEMIITLEDRLTEVRYELENYQSRKKIYDDLICYSTIDITLEEVSYTVDVDDGTFISRIVTGLERSLRDIGSGFVGFIEWFIIHLPYFIVWSVIIFAIVKLVRVVRKKSKAKKMNKQQVKAEQIQKSQQMRQDAIQIAQPTVNVAVSDEKTK